MPYIPYEHETYRLLPRSRKEGGEVFDYPCELLDQVNSILPDGEHLMPYGYESIDEYCTEMEFSLCDNEFFLMDFCSPQEKWSYIEKYIFKLVYPTLSDVTQIRGNHVRRMSYVASYIYLMNYLAKNKLFPSVK